MKLFSSFYCKLCTGKIVIYARSITLVFCLILAWTHQSKADDLSIIRDAEIELYLRELATPILQAAAINPDSVNLVLVRNNTLNAFVAGGMNEFFFTGLLMASETPEQLIGVIAHETGHMAGGHLIRGTEAMKNASTQAIIGVLLGAAAGIATGNGNVAIGAISSAQTIAERSLMGFSRMQESSADSAALAYLDKAGITSQGLFEFMKKLVTQDILPTDRKVAYAQTHPLSQDRVDLVGHHLEKSSSKHSKLSAEFQNKHERMKSKLLGFLQPEAALLRYTDKDKRINARYARAIALYRTNQIPRALGLMDELIKEEPLNPFFYEIKAQALFENGRSEEALPLYKKTVDMMPKSALFRVAYAHTLLEIKDGGQDKLDLAIQNLLEANRIEDRSSEAWRFLATAWGRKAEITKNQEHEALVSYALAEEALLRDSEKEARNFADRALRSLPKNSPYYLRAQDIKLSIKKKES